MRSSSALPSVWMLGVVSEKELDLELVREWVTSWVPAWALTRTRTKNEGLKWRDIMSFGPLTTTAPKQNTHKVHA